MENQKKAVVCLLMRLNYLKRIKMQKLLDALDLDLHFAQLPLLEYIKKHDQCSQKEIADQMQVTPASIALSTKRMQKSGLIIKAPNENNLRRNCLSITAKGRETCDKCRQLFDEMDELMFTGFNDEELIQFRHFLQRLIDNIKDEEDVLDNCFLTGRKCLRRTMTEDKNSGNI